MPIGWKFALQTAWAAVKAFAQRLLARLADANAGAERQRDAQEIEDKKGRDDAGARLADWEALSPEERRARLLAGDDP